jgi:hypothetical protein
MDFEQYCLILAFLLLPDMPKDPDVLRDNVTRSFELVSNNIAQ